MGEIPRVVVSISEIRKNDPDVNRILNQLKVPYVYRDVYNIFSESGVIVFNYKFYAQPYKSAFILHVSKVGGGSQRKVKPLDITFSLKELLDQTWVTNTRLPKRIKKVLDVIYQQFIEPKRDNFELALKGSKTKTPLDYSIFVATKTIKSKGIKKFFCPNQKIEVYASECFYGCNMFKAYIKQTDQIICKRTVVIAKF